MSDFSFDVEAALAQAGAGAGGPSDIIGADGSYVPPGPPGASPFVYGDAQTILYNSKSPQEIASIQSVLAEAGVLRNYTNGRVDEDTINAYEEVLRISNSEGKAPSVVLREMSATNFARNLGANVARAGDRIAQGASAGPTRAPFTARVSNPNDLKRYFRDAVKNATGEYRGQVDIDQMVEAYQAIERNSQAAAYNAAPSGGTVTDAESAESFAERTIGEVAPQQVQTRDVVDRAGQLFDMLGNFGGQA